MQRKLFQLRILSWNTLWYKLSIWGDCYPFNFKSSFTLMALQKGLFCSVFFSFLFTKCFKDRLCISFFVNWHADSNNTTYNPACCLKHYYIWTPCTCQSGVYYQFSFIEHQQLFTGQGLGDDNTTRDPNYCYLCRDLLTQRNYFIDFSFNYSHQFNYKLHYWLIMYVLHGKSPSVQLLSSLQHLIIVLSTRKSEWWNNMC